jgi:hypothetical protein
VLAGENLLEAKRLVGLAGGSADMARAWADGTAPGGPGTKSAKEWSGDAEDAAGVVETFSQILKPNNPTKFAMRNKKLVTQNDLDNGAWFIGETDGVPSSAPVGVTADGDVWVQRLRVEESSEFIASKIRSNFNNYSFCVCDEFGNVGFGISLAGDKIFTVAGELKGGSGDTATALAERDNANILRSMAYKTRGIRGVQGPVAAYNIFVIYGQSLAAGTEAWPALSRTQRFGNLQLGGNVRPSSGSDTAVYTQFTPTGFQPLIAQSVTADPTTSVQISYTDEALLPAGNTAQGEPMNHGWVNFAKALHNERLVVANDPTRTFVSVNPAAGGKTIAQLSKINTQDSTIRYNRYTASLTAAATAAGASSIVCAGILYNQGQSDYGTASGSTNATKPLYKGALSTLIANMKADGAAAYGQANPPPFLITQTSGEWTRDADMNGLPGLHVGMAQLEVSLEMPGVWVVGPDYAVTNKNGGHLDSNGSRGLGSQAGKVIAKIFAGEDWSPLRPLRFTLEADGSILIDFHVPEPPLKFLDVYMDNTATTFATKGFRMTDSAGDVPITVSLVGQTMVRLTPGRGLGSNPCVWYASKTVSGGKGNLFDSDKTVALDKYVYEPTRGMYPSANIAALVDKPYPLNNACVAFYYPVGYTEIG